MSVDGARGIAVAVPQRRHLVVAALVVQAGVVAGWLFDAPPAVRLPFGLAYLLAVPGFAVVGVLRLGDPTTEAALSVAASVALGVTTAQALVWAGAYSEGAALCALGVVSVMALARQYAAASPPRPVAQWGSAPGVEHPAHRRPRRRLLAAVRGHVRVPLFRNAYALIGSTVLTTGLGMLGWIAAARLYPVDDVGRGQSAVNAMIILSGLGSLRLTNVLTRFLPRAGVRSAWLVQRSYLLAGVATLVICAGYLAVDDRIIPVAELVGGSAPAQAWFVVAVVAFAVFTLQDAVLTGVRRATWVPFENGLHGALKLAVVVACAASMTSTGIFASWVVATLIAVVPVNLLIFRRLLPGNARRDIMPEELSVRRLAPFTAAEYGGSLCELAVVNVIPLVIAQQLGLVAAGVFGAAWLIGMTLDHVVVHFGSSLTVEAAAAPTELARLGRELLTRSAAVIAPTAIAVAFGAPLILSLFGADYADQATSLLRLLGIALIPRLVCTVSVVLARIRGDVWAVFGIQAALAVGTLAGTFALLDGLGLAAPGAAYLGASVAVAAATAPSLFRGLAPGPVVSPTGAR